MNFIPIKYFDNYITANLYLNRLEAANISCYLKDENINTILPFLLNALGGIQLCVDEKDFQRANDILKEFITE